MSNAFVTRFAPSPTGYLHLGHAYSALLVAKVCEANSGAMLLRIEDIDHTRCRKEYIRGIYDDLDWLGLSYDAEPILQSRRSDAHKNALSKLEAMELIYPCFCTRKDLEAKIDSLTPKKNTPGGNVYQGTCKTLSKQESETRIKSEPYAMRLDSERATNLIGERLEWTEDTEGVVQFNTLDVGDIVIARKDIKTSYHLAVSVDDNIDGITHVIRGQDLKSSTPAHVLLQKLLKLPTPHYHHHNLLLDTVGGKLAKRKGSLSLKELRESGVKAIEIRKQLGFLD